MSSKKRFDNAYKNAKVIPFDDSSKFILFSDCHRGDNSFADDFANNRNIYFHALKHYYAEGFQYCELGDGNGPSQLLHSSACPRRRFPWRSCVPFQGAALSE